MSRELGMLRNFLKGGVAGGYTRIFGRLTLLLTHARQICSFGFYFLIHCVNSIRQLITGFFWNLINFLNSRKCHRDCNSPNDILFCENCPFRTNSHLGGLGG